MDLNGGSMERSQSRTAHIQGKIVKKQFFVKIYLDKEQHILLPLDK